MMRTVAGVLFASAMMVAPSIGAPPRRASPAAPHRAPPPPHQVPATGTLDAADLVAIARMQAHAADDKFADAPTLAYVGRDYQVTLPAIVLDTGYNRETHTLTVSSPQYQDTVTLQSDQSSRQYVGQNGFGAKATITELRGADFGIWLPGSSYTRKPITYSATLDGPAAKARSATLRLRLSGKVVKADGPYAIAGSTVFDKPLLSDATISDPIDAFVKGYWVAISIDRAEWLDASTGAVVAVAALPG